MLPATHMDLITTQIVMEFPTYRRASGYAGNALSRQRTPWYAIHISNMTAELELIISPVLHIVP